MNVKQVYQTAVVGVLWLSMGVGCRKDPPVTAEQPKSCTDGTCCMQDMRPYDYVETIANAPADLFGKTLIFRDPLPTGVAFQAVSLPACALTLQTIQGLKSTYPLDGSPNPYHYRVWGKVYNDRNTQPPIAVPVLYIYIDRIEEAK